VNADVEIVKVSVPVEPGVRSTLDALSTAV